MTRHLAATLAALLPVSALAQGTPAGEAYDLGTIVFSAGLSPVPEEDYGRSATVLTGDDIAERGLSTVQEALRALPGVSVNGTGRSSMQVRIRGAEANHTLVLIDGVEAAAGDAEYILSGLGTADIERIEVLRGPQSAIYGSNASAGLVNIITRDAAPGLHYGGAAEAGNGVAGSGFASWRGARGGAILSYSERRDDGTDESGDGGEADGIERRTLALAGDVTATPWLRLGARLRWAEEDYDFDSESFVALTAADYVVDDPLLRGAREERTGTIWAEASMAGGAVTHRLAWERTREDRSSEGSPVAEAETRALKYRLSWALDGTEVAASGQVLSLLVEREEDSSGLNPDYGRAANSVAGEYRGRLGGLDVQLGARFDDNETFEDAATWTAGAAYPFANGARLHASAGAGVVNPSYFELFADRFGFIGNPGLEPERNEGFDLGIEVPVLAGRGTVDATYFRETLTGEITPVATGPGTFTYVNEEGESDREGLEVEAEARITEALGLRLAWTGLRATNSDGSVEVRRPESELRVGATGRFLGDRLGVAVDLRHVSGLSDGQFFGRSAVAELPDFTVGDVAARYRLTDAVTLTARVTNLADVRYSEVWGYRAPGREAWVGIEASF